MAYSPKSYGIFAERASQVGLAILQLLRPQLAKLHGGGPAELQQAFELLQDWQLAHNGEWLMQSAMEIQLHEAPDDIMFTT